MLVAQTFRLLVWKIPPKETDRGGQGEKQMLVTNKHLREPIRKAGPSVLESDISVMLSGGRPLSKIYPFLHCAEHQHPGHT